jgi:hypothetical protein
MIVRGRTFTRPKVKGRIESRVRRFVRDTRHVRANLSHQASKKDLKEKQEKNEKYNMGKVVYVCNGDLSIRWIRSSTIISIEQEAATNEA